MTFELVFAYDRRSGCEARIEARRDPWQLGWWLLHGEGEARKFFPDVDLLDAPALAFCAPVLDWLDAVHAYEARCP